MNDTKRNCIRIFADETQIESCKKNLESKQVSIEQLSNILALTGNEVRLKIVYLIEEEKELCPCDLSDILKMSIPATSQHLRKLKDGGLIKPRRSGQTIFYSINEKYIDLLRSLFVNITSDTSQQITI